MQQRNKFLVLLAVVSVMLFAGIAAQAQVTYQITSVPTFVINTGRAEALGDVRLSATNPGPTVASTIQVLYQGISCDNDQTSGITVTGFGVYAAAGAVSAPTVANTTAGCVVSFTVANALAPVSPNTDFIVISGARGRIDFLGGLAIVGVQINASLNATPANSSLFTAPTTVVVATTEPGLIVGATAASFLQCLVPGPGPTVKITEGYNGAFVQHVVTVAGSAIPANPRPTAGANRNTQVNIVISTLPTNVTLTWPGAVNGSIGAYVAGVSGSQLQLLPGSTSTNATYEYACGNQATCDINQEVFNISPAVSFTQPIGFGTATVQAQLYPPLITGDATTITSAPLPAAPKPRFNHPLIPSPGLNFLTTGPCTTNLLYPFVANVLGFDTGVVIANTSSDPYGTLGLPTAQQTVQQSGTCTLYGFPIGGGTTITYTTPSVASGTTFATVLSSANNTAYNGFEGYIIARCNFQYGHGFAFIVNGFGASAPGIAEGYVANVIPDPFITLGRRPETAGSVIFPNEGEGLNQ